MGRSFRALLILFLTVWAASPSPAQQPDQGALGQTSPPWVVSVVHTVDTHKVIERMRKQQTRVGVSAFTPPQIYNIATGLVVDQQGHVVTRLANIDPEDKNQKIAITTADGRSLAARFVGVDCATGFAVLEVESLKVSLPSALAAGALSNGSTVNILSADVRQRIISESGHEKVYFYPSLTQTTGRVKTDSIYSKTHGALTLLSEKLLARNDSSIVLTGDNQVVGIAKYMGYGRAYLYPLEFIRETMAKRVIEKNGSVPAGWLGLVGHSLAQIPDAEFAALGLARRAGVIVREVAPESPAAAAGILPNDVIVRLDETEVTGEADLKALLMSSPAGRNIKLQAIRNQNPVEMKVSLGARPCTPMDPSLIMLDERASDLSQIEQLNARLSELQQRYKSLSLQPKSERRDEAIREIFFEARQLNDIRRALSSPGSDPSLKDNPGPMPDPVVSSNFNFSSGFFGIGLTPQLAKEKFHVVGGVLVAGVRKGSAAERAGLKVGDVIVGTTRQEPMNAHELLTLLANQRAAVSLKVVRRNQEAQSNEVIIISLNNQ